MTRRPLEPTPELFHNPLSRYFAATRPAFLAASLIASLIGLSVVWNAGIALNIPVALVTLLFALMAHAGTNVLNDYYDALNGTDERNTERIFPFTGGSRFIQNGVLTMGQARNFGFALLGGVGLAGTWLMAHSAPQLLYIGLAGLFIGWAYSAPPFSLVSRGLGELCVTAGILLITVGSDFVQRRDFVATPCIAGLPYALLATNLLYVNQFPDRSADTAAGKLHWVARLDVYQACWGYVLITVIANGWLLAGIASGAIPALASLACTALPLSAGAAFLLFRNARAPSQLGNAIRLTIGAMMVHGVLLSLGFVLG